MSKMRYSRRTVLKGGAAAVAASALPAPMVWAQEIKDITLRQFGTGVSNLNDVAIKVKEDLGFTLEMTALDSDSVTQRAATQPKSFDIADIEYWICKKVWPTGNLQAMDTSKIKNFDKISPIFTTGKLTPESVVAQGTAPSTVGTRTLPPFTASSSVTGKSSRTSSPSRRKCACGWMEMTTMPSP